jgi:hypothetical protein
MLKDTFSHMYVCISNTFYVDIQCESNNINFKNLSNFIIVFAITYVITTLVEFTRWLPSMYVFTYIQYVMVYAITKITLHM